MNKIYCVYCGAKNDRNKEKCIKCKKPLDPEEHLFKEYLYNHVKDDLKGKVKDNFLSLITNYIKSNLYGVFITMAVIFSASAGVTHIINNTSEKVDSKPVVTINTEVLDINSDLVKDIYAYNQINRERETEKDFYQDKLVTFNDLSDAYKFDLAFRFINFERSVKHDISTCDFLKGYSLYDYCLQDSEYILSFHYFSVVKKDLEESWHKIFGTNNPLPLGEFTVSEVLQCEYSEENDDYLCFMGMVGGYWVPEQYTKLIKAEKYGNTITLYDQYILFAEDYLTYKDPEEKIKLGDSWDEKLIEKGQLYKHTYKKDKNGNYYWVSSEPIDEIA